MGTQNNVINCDGFSATVIRTKRKKTISIKVDAGKVSIIVPSDLPIVDIKKLLIKRTSWIQKKLLIQSKITPVEPKKYLSGESFSVLGENHTLSVYGASRNAVKLEDGQLFVFLAKRSRTTKKVRELLVDWYKKQANEIFVEKVAHYADILGVQPTAIEVKTYKARWGSCTINAKVQFNWKLIMAPHRIVDYVVVHELCHIIEHNHSKNFWNCVERVLPDYKARRTWLKENGFSLEV